MQLGLEVMRGTHPFAYLGAPAWAAALVAHFWLLSRHAADHRGLVAGLHTAGVWIIAILGAREVGWLIDYAVEGKRVWPSIAWALVPAAVLAALSARRVQARWPVRDYATDYVVNGGAPVAVFLALWTLYANFTSSGDPYPLEVLFLYMANMAWNSAMSTTEAMAMLSDRDPATGEYRIPRIIYADAYDSETVAFAVALTPAAIAAGWAAGDLAKTFLPAISGRGGGKKDMAQGAGTAPDGIPAAIESLRAALAAGAG